MMRINELNLLAHHQKLIDVQSKWIFKHSNSNVIKCDTDSENLSSDS